MRTIVDATTKPATHKPMTADRPLGRPVRSFLQPAPQVRQTPSRGQTKRAERLPATRSPSR